MRVPHTHCLTHPRPDPRPDPRPRAAQDFFRLAAEAPYNFVVDQPFQVRTGPMFPNDPGDEELRSTVFGYRLRRRGPVHSSTV